MTASQQVKEAGLKSLAELSRLSGEPQMNLYTWFKVRKRRFDLILLGVIKEKDNVS